jgi:tRNA U34 5-methylaminomethyl-2-thiouridine-forming methyltransferase MnmC
MDKLDVSRTLVSTGDGSNTLYHPGVGEHYHSRHGALAESKHVFIEMGLKALLARDTANTQQLALPLRVVEIGFGTGLNYLLSAAEAAEAAEVAQATEQGRALDYVGIEAFPLPLETIQSLGYNQFVPGNLWQAFIGLYIQAICEASTYCEKGGVNVLSNSQLRTF